MKRLICFISALFVCCSPCFAWSAESFLGNDYGYDMDSLSYYDYVTDAPAVMALSLDDGIAVAADDSTDSESLYEVNFLNPFSVTYDNYEYYAALEADVYFSSLGYSLPVYVGVVNKNVYTPSVVLSGTSYRIGSGYYDLDFESSGTIESYIRFLMCGYEVVYDIPVPSDSYAVSFSPLIKACARFLVDDEFVSGYEDVFVSYLVNGSVMSNFPVNVDSFYSKEEVFSFSEPITSVQVKFLFPASGTFNGLPADNTQSGTLSVSRRGYITTTSTLSVGFFNEYGSLAVNNQQAQSDINDHNALESEWTGSMTDNFNALSITDFSYPSGLLSGFALLTGIFNDLWNGMGEYKILYVFPLTLGIVLVLVGKLSRTKGGQASSVTNRGDSDA